MEGMEIENVLEKGTAIKVQCSKLNCLTFDLASWIRRALSETLNETS